MNKTLKRLDKKIKFDIIKLCFIKALQPKQAGGNGGNLKEMGRKQKLAERGRVQALYEVSKDVCADFQAAVKRRGRSGRFVIEKFMIFYAKLDDAQEAEFFAQGPAAVGGER